jgi:anaerobic magnesium-protoporphyrin IX monomethyl ester cyclase
VVVTDVCLVSIPTLGRAKSTIVPHWMLWLAGHIERKGYSVDVVDVKSNVNGDFSESEKERVFRETVERVAGSRSPLVGLSGFTEDYRNLVKLASEIKQRTDAKIIVGGIHATVSPEDFFIKEDSPFDAAVVGDGEMVLTNIIETEKNGRHSWEKISGLVFRNQKGVVRTSPQSVFPSLDNMPIHPYDKLDMNFYLQPQQFLLRPIYLSGIHLFTARGCPYACTFCANSRKKVRYRPIDSVIEEIKYLKETYDIDGFYIHDDTFTTKSGRVIEFCEKLTGLKYRFVWGMEGRVNQFPERVFRALKKSGCIQIDLGVESGSQECLNRMKKGITVKGTEEIFRRCRSEKIRTYANILINTPEETEEDVKRTIELMESIKATTYGICVTTPYPGTEIYGHYVRPPLSVEEYQLYEDCKTYTSIVDPRFRLAAHGLNIELLAKELGKRFMLSRSWQIISLHPLYLRVLFASKRKSQYVFLFAFRLFRRLRNLFWKYLLRLPVQGVALSNNI